MNFIKLCLSKIAIVLMEAYLLVVYRPKAHYVNKKLQSNKLKEPRIVIANHTSLYDPPVLYSLLKGKRTIIVAKDWFEKKQYNWIMTAANCIPCDRFNMMDTEWLQLAKKALNNGTSVIIFPEGKIRTDGDLNEFKSGFAFLARYTGVPVLSIGLDGNYKFGHRIHYIVDVPEKIVRTKGVSSSEDLANQSEYFRKKVISLKAQAISKKLVLPEQKSEQKE